MRLFPKANPETPDSFCTICETVWKTGGTENGGNTVNETCPACKCKECSGTVRAFPAASNLRN